VQWHTGMQSIWVVDFKKVGGMSAMMGRCKMTSPLAIAPPRRVAKPLAIYRRLESL
jgi:hypothetical protein